MAFAAVIKARRAKWHGSKRRRLCGAECVDFDDAERGGASWRGGHASLPVHVFARNVVTHRMLEMSITAPLS